MVTITACVLVACDVTGSQTPLLAEAAPGEARWNGEDALGRQMYPLCDLSETSIVKYPDIKVTQNVSVMQQRPPYYEGPEPLSFTTAEIQSTRRDLYGRQDISVRDPIKVVHQFDSHQNLFIYNEAGVLACVIALAISSKDIIAEGKLEYGLAKGLQVIVLREVHRPLANRSAFYSESVIDPVTGFKVAENSQMGTKHSDYFFLLPIGAGAR